MSDETGITMAEEALSMLGEPFDPSQIYTKRGRGNHQYVKGQDVIRRLNKTVMEWSFRITGHTILDMPVSQGVKSVVTVFGELEIVGLGARSGIGVAVLEPNAGEDVIKGAATDCLKKCATLFGVALDLYDDTPAVEAPAGPPRGDGGGNDRRYQNDRPQQSGRRQGGGGPTPKQVEFIHDLLRDTNVDERKVHNRYEVQRLEDLSYAQAKETIDELIALRDQNGPPRR